MIHVRTVTLCTIASELDEALDRLDPLHPAFGPVMAARALFRVHIMMPLPAVGISASPHPFTPPDEPANVDAAGTFQG